MQSAHEGFKFFPSPFTGRGDHEAVGGGTATCFPPSVISFAHATLPGNGEGKISYASLI